MAIVGGRLITSEDSPLVCHVGNDGNKEVGVWKRGWKSPGMGLKWGWELYATGVETIKEGERGGGKGDKGRNQLVAAAAAAAAPWGCDDRVAIPVTRVRGIRFCFRGMAGHAVEFTPCDHFATRSRIAEGRGREKQLPDPYWNRSEGVEGINGFDVWNFQPFGKNDG